MKLKDVDLTKMLPTFMQKDDYDKILAGGMSNLFQTLAENIDKVVIYGQIDKLNEAELDQLAKDNNIFWYLESANIKIKRSIIKNSNLVFNRLGTVWAVEKVLNEYLEGAELVEWFDYDGDPHHFRFKTTDTEILRTDIDDFLWILDKIKRKSQWLDHIILKLKAQCYIYPGFGLIENSKETISFTIAEDTTDG